MLTPSKLAMLRAAPHAGANRLRTAMALAEVTQVELGRAVGISQARISKLVTGRYTYLPPEQLHALSAFFGCRVEDLFPPAKTEAVAS
jgi:DNA-binding Xre family transcriptional regulator